MGSGLETFAPAPAGLLLKTDSIESAAATADPNDRLGGKPQNSRRGAHHRGLVLRLNRKVYRVGRARCLRPYRTLCCPAS